MSCELGFPLDELSWWLWPLRYHPGQRAMWLNGSQILGKKQRSWAVAVKTHFCSVMKTFDHVDTFPGLLWAPWKGLMQASVPRPKLRVLHSESIFVHSVLTLPVCVRIPRMHATEDLWSARAFIGIVLGPPRTQGKADHSFLRRQFWNSENRADT